MKISERTHTAGFPVYKVLAGENEFELSAFGGQLISWTKGGVPILFSNAEHALLDGHTAYRGGAPICFPYFGKGALLPGVEGLLSPQHGEARTSVWTSEVRESSVVFRTRQSLPADYRSGAFECELTYDFSEDVSLHARITHVGEQEAPVQFVVHSYWACAHPSAARVIGLGERYLDNLSGLAESRDLGPDEPHHPPFDRIYLDSSERLELDTDAYRIAISTGQAGNALRLGSVLWNPGPAHSLKDLGSPDFVCLESGVVTPVPLLAAGASNELTIEYRATLA